MSGLQARPWDKDVPMWGEQRAYSWWLQGELASLLTVLDQRFPTPSGPRTTLMAHEMVQALLAVVRVHNPCRHHDSVGMGAHCGGCTTGITTFHDDGPSTHSVDWPCSTIVSLAVPLGLGPAPDGHYRHLLPKLFPSPNGHLTTVSIDP